MKGWLFVNIVIKRTPQGIYDTPVRTAYHIVPIGKHPDSYWTQI